MKTCKFSEKENNQIIISTKDVHYSSITTNSIIFLRQKGIYGNDF